MLMESLGNKLKTAREEKGYAFDNISRETNIAIRYLDALEKEDFDIFPGEPYLLGFLRNYGEYLGLNVDELLSLYRSIRIQEQPVPVEELLKTPSPLPKILLVVALVIVVAAAGVGGFYLFKNLPKKAPAAAVVRQAAEYTMNNDILERRFYRGDSILIPLGDNQYKLELANLGETVTISTPGETKTLDLGQEVRVDMNNDGFGELRVTAMEFAKNDSAAGALLRFEIDTNLPPELAAANLQAGNTELPPEALSTAAGRLAASTQIFSSANAYPFTLQSNFQGYCMFRWEILFERDRRDRNEQYFQRSDELSIQAQNGIRIWVSNAQAVKLQVIGSGRTVPLELGGAGEVVVADVRWVRDEDNRYRLILARLE
jgi:cytoskeletal protein RodZ